MEIQRPLTAASADDLRQRVAVLVHHFGWNVRRVAFEMGIPQEAVQRIADDDRARQRVQRMNIPANAPPPTGDILRGA